MPIMEPPFFPIIYVRGFAGTQSEIEETVADPYMGFNVGSTKVRQLWTGDVDRLYFESPLVRLMKEFGYRDVYVDGKEMPGAEPIPQRPIIIYRYYDQASTQLGGGARASIEDYARGLGQLILQVRTRVCGDDRTAQDAFRVYLVAHSMGGLVCRCFLQNDTIDDQVGHLAEVRKLVDKVFTYATPHNGIDLVGIGNIPGFFSLQGTNTFSRDRMRAYLSLPADRDRVNNLDGKFNPDRFFCLVGTNHRDYDVLFGASRLAAGPMSDGLVRIENATVSGPSTEPGEEKQSPRSFVHRSHSGHYGIVNSEEGYQNLTRFLYGDVRVDGSLEVSSISLPPLVQKAHDAGKAIRASYHFEVILRTRGALWDLHRRTVNENSAIFRSYDDMLKRDLPRHPHLFSAFLSARSRVNKRRASLGFSLDLGVLVPQYEEDGILLFTNHYDGGYLFREKINLEAVPPDRNDASWRLRYGFDSKTPNRATLAADRVDSEDLLQWRIPIEQNTRPGIKARLVLTAREWN